MTGPGNRETPITSWDRGLVQADPDAAIREIRELRAARVRAEEALREALQYAREWPIGLDTDAQEQRGGPRDTLIRNIEFVLAAVSVKDKP